MGFLGPGNIAEMHAAQILIGFALAAFLGVGLVPGLRPYAMRIRTGVLAVYLLGCVMFVLYVMAMR